MQIEIPTPLVDQLLRGAGRRCSRCNATLKVTRLLGSVQLTCDACGQTNITVDASPATNVRPNILQ